MWEPVLVYLFVLNVDFNRVKVDIYFLCFLQLISMVAHQVMVRQVVGTWAQTCPDLSHQVMVVVLEAEEVARAALAVAKATMVVTKATLIVTRVAVSAVVEELALVEIQVTLVVGPREVTMVGAVAMIVIIPAIILETFPQVRE